MIGGVLDKTLAYDGDANKTNSSTAQQLPPRFPRASSSSRGVQGGGRGSGSGGGDGQEQEEEQRRRANMKNKQLAFASPVIQEPSELPTQQLQFPDIEPPSLDLRATRPAPPPSPQYIYQAWVVNNSSSTQRQHVGDGDGGGGTSEGMLMGGGGHLRFTKGGQEMSIRAGIRKNTGGGDGAGVGPSEAGRRRSSNQQQEEQEGGGYWGRGVGEGRPATVGQREEEDRDRRSKRPQTTPLNNNHQYRRTQQAPESSSSSLLPSLFLGNPSGSTDAAREWAVKRWPPSSLEQEGGSSIFERNSPRATRVLRSLLLTFLSNDETYSLRKKIDLHRYSELAGQSISNAALHELCSMRPDIVSLNLTHCVEVDDVGLWAIARHAPLVRELFLTGLYRVSGVGVRSLALRCQDLRILDLSCCPQLDDLALKPLALFKRLEQLSLRHCTGIGDVGVVDAIGGAENLLRLDLTGCTSVKNFRDLILLKVSQSCPGIEVLLMPDAKMAVGDRGLRGLGLQTPPRLHTLHLAPCSGVSGVGLRALARLGPSLTELSISHTKSLRQSDLCTLFSSLFMLTSLEFSHSEDVGTTAVSALVSSATALKRLDLHNGHAVKDQTLRALHPARHVLTDLNVAHCPSVTRDGVDRLCNMWTSLQNLNVTGVAQVDRMYLLGVSRRLPFAQVAGPYLGFQTRPDALRLIEESRDMAMMTRAVIRVQATARRMLARAQFVVLRRDWITKHRLYKAQALIRGHLARVRFGDMKQDLVRNRAALRVQRVWHGYCVRHEWKGIFVQRRRDQGRLASIMRIQRVYRGYRGRRKVTKLRNVLALKEMEEAQLQAAWEVYASRIQKPWRAWQARKRVHGLRVARREALRVARERERGATSMQKVFRGYQGRHKAGNARADKIRHIMEWQSARRIQTRWRIVLAKRILASLRDEARLRKELNAVRTIQRAWRGGRGRYVAVIQKKLAKLRARENKAATTIQKAFRGDRVRKQVLVLRARRERERRENRAACLIQKVYRGHKGRERAVVERELDDAKCKAKPLFEKQALLRDQMTKARDAHTRHSQGWEIFMADIKKFDEEIKSANSSSALWTDSSRIHGIAQRYLTRYLRVKLAEEREKKEVILKSLKTKVAETADKSRDLERQLRMVDREINPLVEGVATRTKQARTKRLRDYVRLRYRAACTIQRVFRGWLLRKALSSWYRDYWIQCVDDATDMVYYFNTWSQETRGSRPYEMKVSEMLQAGGDGQNSKDVPAGWVRKRDPTLKLQYYYNEAKHEFRWESPSGGNKAAATSSSLPGGGRQASHKIYDESWFNRQNRVELVARSHRSRAIGPHWEERRDPDTGVTFYVQPVTKEARWSLSPRSAVADQTGDGKQPQAIDFSVGGGGDVANSTTAVAVAATTTTAVAAGDVGGWVKVVDTTTSKDAVEYYYNTVTGQSQWERPVGYVETW